MSLRCSRLHCTMVFVLVILVIHLLQSEGYSLRSTLFTRSHVKCFLHNPSRKCSSDNTNCGIVSQLSRIKRLLRKRIALIMATSTVALFPGISSARYEDSSRVFDQVSHLLMESSDCCIGTVDTIARESATVDLEVTMEGFEHVDDNGGGDKENHIAREIDRNDFIAANEQGNVLNKVGLLGVGLIFAKTCVQAGNSFRGGKGRPKKTGTPNLGLHEDHLNEIMSKLDSSLEEKRKKTVKENHEISSASESEIFSENKRYGEEFRRVQESSISLFEDKEDVNDHSNIKFAVLNGAAEHASVNRASYRSMSSKFQSHFKDPNFFEDTSLDQDADVTGYDKTELLLNVDESKTTDSRRSISKTKEKISKEITRNANNSKKFFVDRIFRRSRSSLVTDLGTLLMREGNGQIFTAAVAKSLVRLCPDGVFVELKDEKNSFYSNQEFLLEAKEGAEISGQDAADVFAEVSNCIIAVLVDRACNTLSGDEKYTVHALDDVVNFMRGALSLYEKVSGGYKPSEAVVYNGNAKKSEIDRLYLAYARKVMSFDSIVDGFNDTAKSFAYSDDEHVEMKTDDTAEKVERGIVSLESLVRLLSIEEKRKERLDMKMMRGLLMSIASDGNGIPTLSGLLGGAGKNSGGMSGLDEMIERMGTMDPSEFEKMKSMTGDALDLDNWNIEEFGAQSKQAFAGIKEALDAGEMNKSEILEFEKMIGTDIESLLTFMKDAERERAINDKTIKDMLGGDSNEIVHIFQRLVDLKKI